MSFLLYAYAVSLEMRIFNFSFYNILLYFIGFSRIYSDFSYILRFRF